MSIQYTSPKISLLRTHFLFVRQGLVYLCIGEKNNWNPNPGTCGWYGKSYARSVFQMPTSHKYISQDDRIQSFFIASVINVSQGVSQ